jgi:hypothetical protein
MEARRTIKRLQPLRDLEDDGREVNKQRAPTTSAAGLIHDPIEELIRALHLHPQTRDARAEKIDKLDVS